MSTLIKGGPQVTVNYVTVAAVILFIWPIFNGIRRGLARETGAVLTQVISIVATVVAIAAGWWGSLKLAHAAANTSARKVPHWLGGIVQLWQQAPTVAHVIAFVILYFVVSSIIQGLLRFLPHLGSRIIPKFLAGNHTLGGVLGTVVGILRVVVYGGMMYVVLQYLSLPAVAAQAHQSRVYNWLETNVYVRWVNPFLTNGLPVLASNALQPLSDSINLVVVPTLTNGQEQGVLIVPKQIQTLAKSIVGKTTNPETKAHLLYEWEIHHIHYDWKKYNDYVRYGKWDAQTPLQTLQTGEGVCSDYALLYADLAHASGLKVMIVDGIGGTPTDNGAHAWNEVYLPQSHQWIPLDTTWGSQQDAWFNPPGFSQTHHAQEKIMISEVKA